MCAVSLAGDEAVMKAILCMLIYMTTCDSSEFRGDFTKVFGTTK